MLVSIALKEHELELLKAKRMRKKGKTKINDHEILWESDRECNNNNIFGPSLLIESTDSMIIIYAL